LEWNGPNVLKVVEWEGKEGLITFLNKLVGPKFGPKNCWEVAP